MTRQKDIAEALNLSRTTIARAFDPNGVIHPETRKLILEKATELNYRKNILSSVLASKKSLIIFAFIAKSANETYSSDIISGLKKIEHDLLDFNFQIKIIETDINKPQEQITFLEKAIGEAPLGIIITPLLKESVTSFIEQNKNIVFITLDIKLNNSIPHIGADYFMSGKIIGSLYSKFMKKDCEILVLDSEDDNISSKKYLLGLLEILQEKKIKINGPHFYGNIIDDLDSILIRHYTPNVEAIYSSRFINTIIEFAATKYKKNLIAVGNGLNPKSRYLLTNEILTAIVAEDNFDAGYQAGKLVFDIINHGMLFTTKSYVTKPSIIIKENIP